MSRLLKVFLALIAVLLVGLLGIIAAVLLLVDPNEYRGEIEALALEQTGRELTIGGEIGLRVLPCCSVSIDDTRLGNPAGFADDDFVSVRSIRLGLRLLPLLFEQRVVVDEVVVDGLSANLLRQADGSANWEFATAEPVEVPPPDDAEAATTLPELSIAGVSITEARVELRDETSDTHLAVEELTVTTGAIAAGEPVDFGAVLRARDFVNDASVEATLNSRLMLDGNLVSLSALASATEISAAEIPGGTATLTLADGAVSADVESGSVALDGIDVRIAAAGLEVVAAARGSVEGETLALNGSLEVAPFSPRELLAALGEPPIETADPAVLETAAFGADWSLTGERVDVSALTLRLDDSTISGSLGAKYAGPLAVQFDVELDAIDVDRYLPPTQEEVASDSSTPVAEPVELPTEELRDLDLNGSVRIGRLVASGLTLSNIAAKLRAKDGVISLDPSSADLYDGRYQGMLRYDASRNIPTIKFTQSLEAVQSGGIVADLMDVTNVEGIVKARIEGTGRGATTDDLLPAMKATIAFDLDEGMYRGIDVLYEIRKAAALIKGKAPPEAPTDPRTEITSLGFAGKLADGVLRSERLAAELPFLRIDGGGSFDLLQNLLDYKLQARLMSRPDTLDADNLADFEKAAIPVSVTGDAADPKIRVDLKELAKDAAVQKGKDRLLKKLGVDEPEDGETKNDATDEPDERDAARDLLKKGLRDLFN